MSGTNLQGLLKVHHIIGFPINNVQYFVQHVRKWMMDNCYFKVFNVLITLGWIVPQTALTMDHVMLLMDHVTAMLAGLESCVTKRCVPPTAQEMANVINKQPSVFVMIPILVSEVLKRDTQFS